MTEDQAFVWDHLVSLPQQTEEWKKYLPSASASSSLK